MPVFFTKELKNENEKYIELDGAGIIYPYVANKDWNSVYRVEARLKLNVDFLALEDATKKMREKYPYFFSRISKFGNKYVLKPAYSSNVVFKDAPMCKPFDLKGEETLLRVVYTQNTIGIELFHAITDGHGAGAFLNELLKEYCNIVFSKYSYDYPIISELKTNESLLKYDDIYEHIYNLGGKSVSRYLNSSYQFDLDCATRLNSKSINVSSIALKNASHKYGVSVSMYLCAVQIYSILKCKNVKNKVIRISVPVDIRKFFDFDTVRNASLYFLVEINPDKVTDFKSIVDSVKEQFNKNLTKEKMQDFAYSNVKCAKMKAYNLLPINLKKAVLNVGYTTFGENQFTSTLTNLGIFELDKSVKNIVSSVYYVLGEEKTKPLNLSVSTYENETKIVVSSTIESIDFIKTMCEILLCDDIVCDIESIEKPINITKIFNKVS